MAKVNQCTECYCQQALTHRPWRGRVGGHTGRCQGNGWQACLRLFVSFKLPFVVGSSSKSSVESCELLSEGVLGALSYSRAAASTGAAWAFWPAPVVAVPQGWVENCLRGESTHWSQGTTQCEEASEASGRCLPSDGPRAPG